MSAVLDLVLSYNYFLHETNLFVHTEANVEFVNLLTRGAFPSLNVIKFIIALPLLLFILSWFDVIRDSIRGTSMFYLERFGRTFALAIPGLFCVSYCFSGFTWYTSSYLLYDALAVIGTMINVSIMVVLFSLFLLTFSLLYEPQKAV
ncbi:MAG TPA: hypothetical protein VMT57_06155 [Candidatus Thermoplasmatota archaeon]|nr:hypothetical protein [Candidatus Thermoplasmatota archaeon]